MQRGGRRGRGVRGGGARGRGRGRNAAVQNEHLHQNIENEAYDSGPDELQDQIDEFIALRKCIKFTNRSCRDTS